ncbi:AI-2E family transporter [Clostridium sediminicola]|uniref:AI-2E family transporter n=1 Tax=Clostridium sediminicola TaxID=3114879 RepID=UPI0031F1CCDD
MFKGVDKKNIITYVSIITLTIIIYLLLSNLSTVIGVLAKFIGIMSPIIIGFVIAYIFNIPMKAIEERILSKTKLSNKLRRPIALIITIFVLISLFIGIFSFAIPQLADSIDVLGKNIPSYVGIVQKFVDTSLSQYNINEEITDRIVKSWNGLLQNLTNIVLGLVESLYGFVYGLFSGIVSTLLSSILAIYMLLSKEKISLVLKKVLFAFTPTKVTNGIIKVLQIMNKSFENFLRGQILEALIIGVLSFVGMTIFRFEYALLISVIVGITNMIPMFGPYIGGIPSFLILFMVSSSQALWFILFVIVLQQIEGNIIYPRVVGSSMGLSGFWVLVAVIIGNNLFGMLGIIIGIPIFSTIYTLTREITNNKLEKKGIEEELKF